MLQEPVFSLFGAAAAVPMESGPGEKHILRVNSTKHIMCARIELQVGPDQGWEEKRHLKMQRAKLVNLTSDLLMPLLRPPHSSANLKRS